MAFLWVAVVADAQDDSAEGVALVSNIPAAGMGWHLEDTETRRQQVDTD